MQAAHFLPVEWLMADDLNPECEERVLHYSKARILAWGLRLC